ncbi:MAG: prepilin peptidase [Pyrinomonadaceae bacterium]|nr:prepilin peptidase [Phycisphaerales bacterium]
MSSPLTVTLPNYELYALIGKAMWACFVFVFGSCVGSLVNVLVYRLPIGISVLTPPSRCPMCETRLTWRENIPIFGWLLLRGRCRFCKSRISPEYPIVELIAGLLFVGVFYLWYLMPADAAWLGVHWGELRPHWTIDDIRDAWPRHSWPIFVIMLMLIGSLLAMTIVDAKTYTIPLVLPWFVTIVGFVGHPLFALWVQERGGRMQLGKFGLHHPPWVFSIPETWATVAGAGGGMVGLIIAMLLMRFNLIRRSFTDYDEWETKARADLAASASAAVPPSDAVSSPATAGDAGAFANDTQKNNDDAQKSEGTPAEMWIQYPHARREMLKELAFVSPCVVLGYGAWILVQQQKLVTAPSLFFQVLAAVVLGYLIGGGIVWLVRIFGSLAFGKEAMGLGDVHLMAAVGACLGWQHAVIAFFGAAFVGIAWEIFGRIFMGSKSRALPYGPHLAISTFLVLVFKPWVELGLDLLGLGMIFR